MKIIKFIQEFCAFAIGGCLVAFVCNAIGVDTNLFYAAYHDATGSFVPFQLYFDA
jgi:hypothetical protein